MELKQEPHATSKHTLCGYAWGDVLSALMKAIGSSDNIRAQRWSAELVCSELGMGRLEATLLHSWALHIGSANPTWPRMWYNSMVQIRSIWAKSNGDIKTVRNTPIVRQLVADATAMLVFSGKKEFPSLPTSKDCFREAEAMRSRLRSGGGVGDQVITRRIWSSGQDGADLKTIGNEFEAALRANQIPRMLFWVIWLCTLDSQPDAPPGKERGPSHLSKTQKKSLLWFLVDLLRELANETNFLSVEERNGIFGCLELTWPKLGIKGRRDTIVCIALCIQDHIQRRSSLSIHTTPQIPQIQTIKNNTSNIDSVYSTIADEAKRFLIERPEMNGLTEIRSYADTVSVNKKQNTVNESDKLSIAFGLIK